MKHFLVFQFLRFVLLIHKLHLYFMSFFIFYLYIYFFEEETLTLLNGFQLSNLSLCDHYLRLTDTGCLNQRRPVFFKKVWKTNLKTLFFFFLINSTNDLYSLCIGGSRKVLCKSKSCKSWREVKTY